MAISILFINMMCTFDLHLTMMECDEADHGAYTPVCKCESCSPTPTPLP